MTATGWCEDCGDIEVEPMCHDGNGSWPAVSISSEDATFPECCHYADCLNCLGDVDQWAWA